MVATAVLRLRWIGAVRPRPQSAATVKLSTCVLSIGLTAAQTITSTDIYVTNSDDNTEQNQHQSVFRHCRGRTGRGDSGDARRQSTGTVGFAPIGPRHIQHIYIILPKNHIGPARSRPAGGAGRLRSAPLRPTEVAAARTGRCTTRRSHCVIPPATPDNAVSFCTVYLELHTRSSSAGATPAQRLTRRVSSRLRIHCVPRRVLNT